MKSVERHSKFLKNDLNTVEKIRMGRVFLRLMGWAGVLGPVGRWILSLRCGMIS